MSAVLGLKNKWNYLELFLCRRVLFCEFIRKLVIVWGVDYDIAIDCLPPIMTSMIVFVKYLNGVLHIQKMKEFCIMIKSDTERLMNLPDYDVLHMHALEGRKLVVSFIISLIVLLMIYLTLPTVLIVNDVIVKNDSEDKYLMYQVDYIYFEAQDYYYIITAHCYLASILITLLILPFDLMYIIFTQHACAMFAVVGYRLKMIHVPDRVFLEKQMDETKYKKLLIDEQEQEYEKLVSSVKEHKRALECAEVVQSAFSVTLFFQVMLNIVCLSTTGVQALLMLSAGRVTDTLRLAIWMMGQYIHLLFIHLPGQRLSNFSEQVYYDALECTWYTLGTKSQIVYKFLILNTLVPCQMTALKVTTLSMETFLAVTQAAMSYFTVLSSTL